MIRLVQTILVALVFSLASSAVVYSQVPIRPSKRSNTLNAQYHRAETAWKSGHSMLEAKARVDQVITALPDDHEALVLRARILLSMDSFDLAFDDAFRAAELQPSDAETFAVLCEAARKSGRLEDAKDAMDVVSSLIIDDAQLQVHLSREAMALEQFDRAEAFARTAMVQAPKDPSTHFQMARVFAAQGKVDEARTILANGITQRVLTRQSVESDTLLRRILLGDLDG